MSKQDSNRGIGIRLSAEEAKRLAEQPNARKRSRHPNAQNDGGIDYISLLWSMTAFLAFLGAIVAYLYFTGGDKVIKPMEAGTVSLTVAENSNYEETVRDIEQLWNTNQLEQAIASINMIWDQVNEQEPRVAQNLALLKLKAFVVLEQYQVGNRYALTLMQRYRGNDYATAEIFWYRAHIYYYQQDYGNALNAFDQVIELGGTHAIKAQEYSDDINDAINDDMAWF